jgi:hypothetical protein
MSVDTQELERKIAQASRIVFRVGDQTTAGRLLGWINEMEQQLQRHRDNRHTQDDIRRRAQELWQADDRPTGRDLEFWLRAEAEITGRTPVA